jgi:hypothetical protein
LEGAVEVRQLVDIEPAQAVLVLLSQRFGVSVDSIREGATRRRVKRPSTAIDSRIRISALTRTSTSVKPASFAAVQRIREIATPTSLLPGGLTEWLVGVHG